MDDAFGHKHKQKGFHSYGAKLQFVDEVRAMKQTPVGADSISARRTKKNFIAIVAM